MAPTPLAPTPEETSNKRADSAASSIAWDTYNFEWLFDPNRIDHLPIEEQLKQYKARDLSKTKLFKIASKIFGGPLSRKRVFVAPEMNRGGGDVPFDIQPQQINSSLQPQEEKSVLPSKEQIEKWKSEDKESQYKAWVSERKAFRGDLENMGLNMDWLCRKPNKTALEQRVLRRMWEEKYPKAPTPPPVEEVPLDGVMRDDSPVVKRPSPLAIRIIEKFLHEKKMRLLDLFATVDKNKDWNVTRNQFRDAVIKAKIPISEVLLEDLILALDTDLNDRLDYRELAKGMGLWKIEKRESKRKVISSGSHTQTPAKFAQASGYETPEREPLYGNTVAPVITHTDADAPIKDTQPQAPSAAPVPRVKSALSTISSSSSLLEPPEPDTRPEQRILASEEAMLDLRKRDREALARNLGKKLPTTQNPAEKKKKKKETDEYAKTMIKTGDRAIDRHMMPSTMGGDTADLVDKFRHLKYKEYNDICHMCRDNNIPLSEHLLKKVLLFPPDKSHNLLRKKIRQPGGELVSIYDVTRTKRPASPAHSKGKKSPGPGRSTSQGHVTPSLPASSGNYKKTGYSSDHGDSGNENMFSSRRAGSGSSSMGAGFERKNLYPSRASTKPVPHKMNLSTGKAIIRPHVNCWMTYEEYEKLTRHLAVKYNQIHGPSDDNAFWPGHLLDKMRLCMPNAPPQPQSAAVFQPVGVLKQHSSNRNYSVVF